MIRGSVGHPEGRRGALLDPVWYPGQSFGGHHHLFGEGAVHSGAGHPITDGEITCAIGDFGHYSGELAAHHEGRRHADLIMVGDQQDVGIIDRGGADPHPNLSGFEPRRRPVLDTDHFRRPVVGADRCAHR